MKKPIFVIFAVLSALAISLTACDEPSDLDQQLIDAVKRKQFDAAERLIAEGADINAHGYLDATPLHKVIGYPDEMAEFLLANGADPNLQDSTGHTPLNIASCYMRLGSVRVFLKHGS